MAAQFPYSPPQGPPPPRAGGSSCGKWALIGGAGCFCVVVVGGLVLLILAVWVGSTTASLQSEETLPESDRQTIRSSVPLPPDEEILLAYTLGLTSYEEDTFFFTHRRVVAYQRYNRPETVQSATYDQIVDIRSDFGGGAINPSTIVVTLADGGEILLMIPTTEGDDRRFFNMLHSQWRQHGGGAALHGLGAQ